ncbi:MAG: hypothetical protein MEQ74_06775 [Paracoccus sp.]|nr:hypothetical protein [Paracoccus sp. (in: a-proteobacteria)]
MSLYRTFTAAALVAVTASAMPALADPGRGNGNHRGGPAHAQGCPPGLAKKSPACVPPGQARQIERRYGRDVGQVLRVGDYALIRDPRRFELQQRDGWRYYRDGDRAYRVDAETQQILAIITLARALIN